MTQAFGSAAGVQDSYKRQAHPGEEPRSSPPPQIVPVKRKPEVAAWVSLLRGNSFATALFSGWVPSLPQHPRDQSVKLCKHCCLPDAAGVSPGLFQNPIPRPPSQALLPQVGSSPGHDQTQMSEDRCTQRSSFADPWQPHLLLGPRPLLSPTTAFFIFSHRHSMGPKLSSRPGPHSPQGYSP